MPVAAVPTYLGRDFKDASPGMRFGMYLSLWGIKLRTKDLLWETYDIDYEIRGQDRQEREVRKENKVSALSDARKLNTNDKSGMEGLLTRQRAAFASVASADAQLVLEAVATAPFTTGLGNEHPLENGFAFLNPYGLPYLPGSGVKGVLRQAARELASGDWGETQGWRDEAITALFGKQGDDGDTDHLRGALVFWDVIPQIKGDSLAVDIMTPHQSHYYQQKRDRKAGDSTNPHDSGQPNPISFLTVPPGSGFAFHVQCDLPHLRRTAPELAEDSQWKVQLEAAFQHAFRWLGFGAKTAVGYGAMSNRKTVESTGAVRGSAEATARVSRERGARVEANETTWHSATLTFNRSTGEIAATFEKKSSLGIKGADAQAFLTSLGEELAGRLRKKRELKSIAVRVEVLGNRIKLLGLAEK